MIVVTHAEGTAAHEEAAAMAIRGRLADQGGIWTVQVVPDPPCPAARPATWRQLASYILPLHSNRDGGLIADDAMLSQKLVVPTGTQFCGVAFVGRELRLFALTPPYATSPLALPLQERREIEIHREASTVAASPGDPRGFIGLAVLDNSTYLVFERTSSKCSIL